MLCITLSALSCTWCKQYDSKIIMQSVLNLSFYLPNMVTRCLYEYVNPNLTYRVIAC